MTESLTELLERCRKGEQSAYQILVQRYQGKALDLATALTGDRHLAEDAIQEAFMTAFCRLSQLREPDAFVGWFRQIVRTEALRVSRKNSNIREKLVGCRGNKRLPDENAELEELREIIHQAISELSESNRQTAKLFYLDEQSCIEVSNQLNVPVGTVKRRLYDVRQKLRNMLLGYVKDFDAEKKTKRKHDKQAPL